MSDLFFSTRSFHCLWLPCPNLLPPKPLSKTLPFSPSFPFPRSRFTFTSTHHTHILPNSTSSSTPIPQEDEEVHVISSTQCSDGSFVFRFGNASEIREMIAELNQQKLVEENVEEVGFSALVSDGVEKLTNEDDGNLGEEIESSSTVVVAVADQNPHLFVSEKESVVVLDSDLVTPVINDLQKVDGHLKLDSVEDGDCQNGICSEDVAEPNVVPSVSKEDSRVDSYKEVVVSTVSPESDVFSDLSSRASMEVEEKEEVDNSRGVDREANSSAGGVDVADLTELVQVSTSLESDISVIRRTNNLPGSVDADKSELEPLSTSLESEQDDYSATDNLTGSVYNGVAELVPVSTSSESEQVAYSATDNLINSVDNDISELAPVSTSLESEQDDYSATDNLTGSVDNGVAELVPASTFSESEQVAYSATDNLTNSVDTDISELVPVSTSLESEQVVYSATDNLAGSVDADVSEPVSVSTYLESEQVDYSATDNLTGSVDAELSELMPVSFSLESEEVDYNATDNLAGSVDASVSELVPVSTSLESEQVDYSEKDNLTGRVDDIISEFVPVSVSLDSAINNLTDGVDAKVSEPVPISTSLEPEQVDYSATDNMTDSVDADISELVPVSTSLDSEQVKYSAADDLAPSVDDGISELVPASTSLDSKQSVNGETNHLTDGVDAEFSEPVPISTSLEPERVDYSSTDNMTDNVDAEISELVPTSTSLDSEQSVTSETNHLTAGVDAELSESVPISSLEPEQVGYSATDYLNGGVDTDLSESAPVSTSLGSELHANDDETSHHVVDDSVDASKTGKSALLDDLVPSSDLENKIDVGNTESSDEENPLLIIVPEVHPIEMASNGEQISRTELFLVSGAAILPHPSTALTSREDAYFISRQNWFVVADGVGQWSLEGSNTGVYIRELMEKCENIVSNYENIKPAEVLTRSAAETQSPGSSSVLAAYFDGQALHAANVGNTGFIIIRDGSIFKISNAMFHEFSFPIHIMKDDDHSEIIQEYKIDLNDGDVIVFATNGLFDNLYEQEIASTISKSLQASLTPQEIAEILATRAQEVGKSKSSRSPFGDAAKALGYVGYAGGKLDDVTVIVSLVQTT